jgi:hypothetical protein
MQSCKDLPPPPATLGAASVGLVLEPDGEATVSVRAKPPEVRVVVVMGGDNGAGDWTRAAGAPIAGAGVGAGDVGGEGSALAALRLEVGTDVVAAAADGAVEGPLCGDSC